MPKTILDRYNDAGDAGKLGSSSIPTRPLKKVHLVPVWDTDNNVGRVVKASDLLTDNPAFVMTMVMSGAYSIVLGTAVYDEETPPNLVSAEIQWADGTAGTIEREITDGNGSTEDTFSRIIPGATTQWYKHTTLYDDDGTVKGGGFMAAGDGLAVLTVTGTLLPFVVYEGDTPDLCETNTGIQAIKLETINTEELVKVVPPSGWKVSSDEGVHWEDELSLDCSDSGVTIWVRLKETVVDAYAGTLSISVGVAHEEFSLTGYICDGDAVPYYIILPQQLDAVRDHLDADHEQVADIDLSAYQSGVGWVPIGAWDAVTPTPFEGVYDGGGHKITGLVGDGTGEDNNCGLFGYCDGAAISNLTIEDADIIGDRNSGILCGYGKDLAVSNVIVSGAVVCNALTTFTAGGLVGGCENLWVDSCTITADVTGAAGAGGLVGMLATSGAVGTTMEDNSYDGTVLSSAGSGGGIVGYITVVANAGVSLARCASHGAISGVDAGGLIGGLGAASVTITNCYSQADIESTDAAGYAGGLIGAALGGFDPTAVTVVDSYAASLMSGTGTIKGVVGQFDVVYSGTLSYTDNDSYWDTELSDPDVGSNTAGTDATNAVGKTTAQMKLEATYAGWDSDVWDIAAGSYPTLKAVV